jgi:hypothetical protein
MLKLLPFEFASLITFEKGGGFRSPPLSDWRKYLLPLVRSKTVDSF